MSQKITISVERSVELFLHGRPYGIIGESDELYAALNAIPKEQRIGFVLENDPWTVGYNTDMLQQLNDGMCRLWNKADWENCDNRHRQAVAKANIAHEHREAKLKHQRDCVYNSMKAAGVQPFIIDMLLASNTATQIEAMYNILPKEQQ